MPLTKSRESLWTIELEFVRNGSPVFRANMQHHAPGAAVIADMACRARIENPWCLSLVHELFVCVPINDGTCFRVSRDEFPVVRLYMAVAMTMFYGDGPRWQPYLYDVGQRFIGLPRIGAPTQVSVIVAGYRERSGVLLNFGKHRLIHDIARVNGEITLRDDIDDCRIGDAM